jgi:hypothetical protein
MTVRALRRLRKLLRVALEIVEQGQFPPPELSNPRQAKILVVMTDRPQTARRIAGKVGGRLDAYFYRELGALVDAGHVRHVRQGYVLP